MSWPSRYGPRSPRRAFNSAVGPTNLLDMPRHHSSWHSTSSRSSGFGPDLRSFSSTPISHASSFGSSVQTYLRLQQRRGHWAMHRWLRAPQAGSSRRTLRPCQTDSNCRHNRHPHLFKNEAKRVTRATAGAGTREQMRCESGCPGVQGRTAYPARRTRHAMLRAPPCTAHAPPLEAAPLEGQAPRAARSARAE